jgi:5-methylcytosine-specific restriction endonuclease McrA
VRERQREYRSKYPEKTRETHRNIYLKYKNIQLQRAREIRSKNPERFRAYCNSRRARERNLPNTYTAEQWDICKNHFNNFCAYCGEEKPLEQEHFLALSKGGEYTHNNIIPVCKSCNSGKQDNDFFDWYPKQDFYNKKREKKILKFLNYNNGIQQLSLTI